MSENIVDTENQNELSARRELYEVYADTSVKPRHKRKLIESLDEIYGYDLAFLVGLIMRSEFSGNLNVISQSNEISGVSFSRGKITKIDLNDKETFMGELLIKDGFLTREKLLQLLKDQSKPLGELLIINNIATSDQIINVLVKQMRLRLSKYINSNKYRVNFSESDISDPGLSISYPEYLGLAHDWVAGRFSPEWLKLHYMELSEGLVEVPQDIGVYPAVKILPLSTDLSNTLKTIADPQIFSKIFNSIKVEKDQEYFLKCFHYGIMSGQLMLKHNPNAEANSDSILKNIYSACSKKTGVELVETLAHILKYKPTEIDSIFQAINNYIHTYSGDDYDMKNNMFRIVLEMLSKKQFYYEEINKKYSAAPDTSKNVADLNKKITEIYRDLLAKNLFLAIDRLKKINEFGSQTPKIKLFMVWAKALMIQQNNIRINLAELDREFLQILPEDKDTADYFYVKALLSSLKKEDAAATTYYQQSVKLNSELKNYPPFKQAGSFIKKLFKFSLVLLLCTTARVAWAQAESAPTAPPADAEVKTDQPTESPPPSTALAPSAPSAPSAPPPAAMTIKDESAPQEAISQKPTEVNQEILPPAQPPAATAAAEPAPVTIAKNKLPFVYLNQYFNYKVVNQNNIQINDVLYNLDDMILKSVGPNYEVELKGTLAGFNQQNPSFLLRSVKEKKNLVVKHSEAGGKYTVNRPTKTDITPDYVCLYKKNQFTSMQVCKAVKPVEKEGVKSLTVNSQSLDPEGIIILNETNTKKIVFNMTKNNNDFFSLDTIKRLVLPVKLEKLANSDEFDIQFIDSGNSRYSWEDKINLNQNFFPLKFDELVVLKQGIYFSSSVTTETGMSQVFIEKDRLQKKYFNRISAEPLIVYNELTGKSSTTDAILRSDMGIGLSVTVDHFLEDSQSIFGGFSFYSTKLSPTTTSTTIQDAQTSLMSLFGGYRYIYNEHWSFSGVFRLKEDMFFNQATSTSVALTKALVKSLGINPDYTIYNQNQWLVNAGLGIYVLLPTDVPNSTTTSMGTAYELDLKAAYKIDWGRLTGGMIYGNRAQKNDTYTYNSSDLAYHFGLVYLF